MIIIYDILLLLLFIPAVLIILLRYRNRKNSDYLSNISERLGFWDFVRIRKVSNKPLLWVHCASLGEIRAVESLIGELREDYTVLLTILTFSGKRFAVEKSIADYIFYAPVDSSFIIKRIIYKINPLGLILVETELWPGLIWAFHKAKKNIVLVNSRLSEKSFPYYKFAKPFWKPFIRAISFMSARSKEDKAKFISLGYDRSKISVSGNIKYDHEFTDNTLKRKEIFLNERDLVWTAGSTRSGEEEIILKVFSELKKEYSGLKLIIAPRHLERIGKLESLVKRFNISYAKRSGIHNFEFDCLILDTFGELRKIYALSDIVFIGGSLVDKGGQNPIEPAAYSKPVLFGPNMQNFKSEAGILMETGGGIEVSNSNKLKLKISEFIDNPVLRTEIGKCAFKALESQRGSLKRTKDIIERVMGK